MRLRGRFGGVALWMAGTALLLLGSGVEAQVSKPDGLPVGGAVQLAPPSEPGPRGYGARPKGVGEASQEELEVSPGRAFLRSLVIPGWGHAAVGAYTRGGAYFLFQGATGWMLYKSAEKRASARAERDLHLSLAESRARAEGVQDPDSVRLVAEDDERVQEFEELVESRGEQVEDWAALGVFLVLMGAADAFVSAHLADFPEPLSYVDVVPWFADGGTRSSLPGSMGIGVGMRIPLGRR